MFDSLPRVAFFLIHPRLSIKSFGRRHMISETEHRDLNLVWPQTMKTAFLATRPISQKCYLQKLYSVSKCMRGSRKGDRGSAPHLEIKKI